MANFRHTFIKWVEPAHRGRTFRIDTARTRPPSIASTGGAGPGAWDRLLEAASKAYDDQDPCHGRRRWPADHAQADRSPGPRRTKRPGYARQRASGNTLLADRNPAPEPRRPRSLGRHQGMPWRRTSPLSVPSSIATAIEGVFNRQIHFRGVTARYDKCPDNYLAGAKLAAARIWIRFNESGAQLKPKGVIRTPKCSEVTFRLIDD